MRILRIVYDWPDENVITEGLAPAPYELSISQTKLGHKIFVLCGNLNGKNLKRGKFHYSLENADIEVYNLPRALWRFGPFFTTSVFVLPYYFYLKLFQGIQLVHNHQHLGVWFLLYKWIFAFLDKTPVVAHLHITAEGREKAAILRGEKIDFFVKNFEWRFHKLSDWLSARVAQQIITVGKDTLEEISQYLKVDKSRIHLIESGVDSSRFKKDPVPYGNRASGTGGGVNLNFEKGSKILANGGRLSKRKNIDIIIKALALLPKEYKLVLWGEWDIAYKKSEIDSVIKENNLESRIKYLGKVSYFKVDNYYRACEIFLLPSSYEGLPKAVVEALASGCKVIASGFKTEHEIPNLYFLKNVNAKELSNLILEVDGKPNMYQETRQVIEKYYSWDSKAKAVDGVYALVKSQRLKA